MATLTDAQIAAVAKSAGFTGRDLTLAVAVALAESGGQSDAINRLNADGSIDYGLWQINSVHTDLLRTGTWSNPADNARMAYTIFHGAGNRWSPWSAYNNGSYLRFYARGLTAAGNPNDTLPTPDVTGSTENTLLGIPNPLSPIGDFFKMLTDVHMWIRVGYFLFGGALITLVVLRISGLEGKIASGAKAAAGAIALA